MSSVREAVVGAEVGLHARPASLFVQAVAATGSRVSLAYGGRTVNAASILGVLSLGVPHGATVVLESDEAHVLEPLVELLESGLNDS